MKRGLVIVLLATMVISVLAMPATAEGKVTRNVSTTNPLANEEIDVTLAISFKVGGIIETIPDGFKFVSATYPSNHTTISGQRVAFAVINENQIEYKIKAPAHGNGTFSGVWVDILNETKGTIADTAVYVRATPGGVTPVPTVTPSPKPSPSPTATPASEVPGFEAIFVTVSLLIVYLYLFVFRKKGGDR